MVPEDRAKVLPYIRDWAETGARVSGVEAVRGYDETNAMRRACGRLFTRVDAVLSPTIPVVSYPAEWASPLNDPARPFEHIAFTVPWNMSEQPALSLKLRLLGLRPADRVADRGSALRGSLRLATGVLLRSPAGADRELAGAVGWQREWRSRRYQGQGFGLCTL